METHLKLKKNIKILTIIAPRHIDRVKEIEYLCNKLNLNVQILNHNEQILADTEVIIINYFGALKNYFKHAKSVLIGKSIIKKFKYNGGQNPIEAAKLNCKIYHGPYVYNFEEIYEAFEKNQISKKIKNSDELSQNLIIDLDTNQKDSQISKSIEILAKKTFVDTMKLVNGFI